MSPVMILLYQDLRKISSSSWESVDSDFLEKHGIPVKKPFWSSWPWICCKK